MFLNDCDKNGVVVTVTGQSSFASSSVSDSTMCNSFRRLPSHFLITPTWW
jgi:hypothetical protein